MERYPAARGRGRAPARGPAALSVQRGRGTGLRPRRRGSGTVDLPRLQETTMASLLRRFAPMIITFVVGKIMKKRSGGGGAGTTGGRYPRR
nr:hypothetical protein GCM10025699_66000 [Microbacterium flavescens]